MNKFFKAVAIFLAVLLFGTSGIAVASAVSPNFREKVENFFKINDENSISTLKSKLAKLEEERDSLKTEINGYEARINSLKEQIRDLEARIEELQAQDRDLNSQISNLQAQVRSLESQVNTLENTIADLNSQVEALDKQVDNVWNLFETYEVYIQSSESGEYVPEIKVSVEDKQMLDKKVEELETKIDTLTESVNELTEEIKNLEEEIDDLKNQKQEAKDNKEKNEVVIVEKKTEVNNQKKTIENLNVNVEKIVNNITINETKIIVLEEKEKSNTITDKEKQELSDLRETNKNLETQRININQEINNLQTKVDRIESEVAVLEQNNAKYEKQIEELDTRISTLQENVNELAVETTNTQNNITALQTKVNKYKGFNNVVIIEKEEHKHTKGEPVREKEVLATCTTDGSYELNTYCKDDNTLMVKETVTVPALGHEADKPVIENRVENENGIIEYDKVTYCSRCNEKISSEHIVEEPTHEHTTKTRRENEVAVTCTTDGSYDIVTYCEECGENLSRKTETIEALGHDYSWEIIGETNTNHGTIKYTCGRCENSYTDCNGISIVSNTAKCEENGIITYHCHNCGRDYSKESKALGHEESKPVIENRTQNDKGIVEYDNVTYCTRCNKEISREHIIENTTTDTEYGTRYFKDFDLTMFNSQEYLENYFNIEGSEFIYESMSGDDLASSGVLDFIPSAYYMAQGCRASDMDLDEFILFSILLFDEKDKQAVVDYFKSNLENEIEMNSMNYYIISDNFAYIEIINRNDPDKPSYKKELLINDEYYLISYSDKEGIYKKELDSDEETMIYEKGSGFNFFCIFEFIADENKQVIRYVAITTKNEGILLFDVTTQKIDRVYETDSWYLYGSYSLADGTYTLEFLNNSRDKKLIYNTSDSSVILEDYEDIYSSVEFNNYKLISYPNRPGIYLRKLTTNETDCIFEAGEYWNFNLISGKETGWLVICYSYEYGKNLIFNFSTMEFEELNVDLSWNYNYSQFDENGMLSKLYFSKGNEVLIFDYQTKEITIEEVTFKIIANGEEKTYGCGLNWNFQNWMFSEFNTDNFKVFDNHTLYSEKLDVYLQVESIFGCINSNIVYETTNEYVPYEEKHEHIIGEAIRKNEIFDENGNVIEYDLVKFCLTCGEEFSIEHIKNEIQEHEHIAGTTSIINEIFDDNKNVIEYDIVIYCSVCGEEFSREHIKNVIDEHEHIAGYVNKENYKEAYGYVTYEEVTYCQVCEEEFSRIFYKNKIRNVSNESSLLKALNEAQNGDIINLNKNIVLTEPLNLDKNLTIRNGGFSGKSVNVNADITFNNVTFSEVSNAKNNASNVYAKSFAGNLIFTNCTFENSEWDNIQVTPVTGSKIEIRNCTFNNCGTTQRYVHIEGQNEIVECEVIIEKCNFNNLENLVTENRNGEAIGVYFVSKTQLRYNIFSGTLTEAELKSKVCVANESPWQTSESKLKNNSFNSTIV